MGKQIKAQHFDVNGQLVHTEYYAAGEYELVLEQERKSQIASRNAAIAAIRAERYKNEIDIYAVRYKRGATTEIIVDGQVKEVVVDDAFIDGLYAKIKAELPYEEE